MDGFLRAGSAAGLGEGDLGAYEVGDRYVVVARVEGVYYAFDDRCTHRGCSLSEGELDGTTIRIPVAQSTHVFFDGKRAGLDLVRAGLVAIASWKADKAAARLQLFDASATVAVGKSTSARSVVGGFCPSAAGVRAAMRNRSAGPVARDLRRKLTGERPSDRYFRDVGKLADLILSGGFEAIAGVPQQEIMRKYENK